MAVPSDIANNNLWLMPEDLSAGAVASWTDRSAAANNASQATAGNQPSKTTDAGGLPVVRFVGSSFHWLDLAGNPVRETATSAYTLFLVVNVTTGGDQWIYARDDETDGREVAIGYNGTTAMVVQVNGTTILGGAADVPSGWQYFAIEVDNDNGGLEGVHRSWRAGSLVQDVTIDPVVAATVTTPTSIGRRSYSGFEGYCTMDLRSVFSFSRRLNSTELADMNTYAASLLTPSGATISRTVTRLISTHTG